MGQMSRTTTEGGTTEQSARFTASISRTICTPDLAEKLKAITARTGAPQSYHVRRAVEEYLERQETNG